MQQNVVEEYEKDGLKIQIVQDDSPESPREWDNAGTMVCWHREYNLGDKNEYSKPRDFLIDVINKQQNKDNDFENIEEGKLMEMASKKAIIKPLYLYDHSGITMSTSRGYPYNDPWDAGQVGYIYMTHDQVKKEYGKVTPETLKKADELMDAEVKTYDQYLRGDVYGYRVLKPTKYTSEEGNSITSDDDVDSVWGFYGMDEAKKAADESAAYYLEQKRAAATPSKATKRMTRKKYLTLKYQKGVSDRKRPKPGKGKQASWG